MTSRGSNHAVIYILDEFLTSLPHSITLIREGMDYKRVILGRQCLCTALIIQYITLATGVFNNASFYFLPMLVTIERIYSCKKAQKGFMFVGRVTEEARERAALHYLIKIGCLTFD